LSSSIDPANGIDTSEMANFLNMFAAVVYLQNGGLVTMVDVLNKSYQLCDPMNECTPSLPPLLTFINQVAQNALVLASPVVLVLLLSEVFLGLLSRFAPQMNAFAISLTVKSGIAVLIMLLYFSPVLPDNVLRLSFQATGLSSWFYERGATHVLE
ncbi:SPI-1 type III secretion system export apparatus protein SpaR, partial [Salmonella enterica subsp. enterica serovar Kentucky]|nr:SPI-1 type III secretion system export apparatus protein SpaR [Salmonella enterica]ECS4970152.1 SPI-1 type III secretion system export apparatus protein SpaR [Salmonella enterica subsp. enterica]ECX3338326.1 SPI-1 type III secretion system export apparatus protein SpaR [Salmonella enterica subsp. enterica serovar Schwarzengrund]EJV1784384.1 SPI-1 type III secretion system export apparatus protein SpaR [Salmonella enterica subsp. enterica serovar Kentucky]MEA5944283.1 SPI-1 type III secretion